MADDYLTPEQRAEADALSRRTRPDEMIFTLDEAAFPPKEWDNELRGKAETAVVFDEPMVVTPSFPPKAWDGGETPPATSRFLDAVAQANQLQDAAVDSVPPPTPAPEPGSAYVGTRPMNRDMPTLKGEVEERGLIGDEILSAQDEEASALAAQELGQVAGSLKKAEIELESADAVAEDKRKSQDAANDMVTRANAAVQNAQDMTPDRGRWWRNASVAQQIGAAISAIGGGILSVYHGGKNSGMDFIMKLVDSDVADQQQEYTQTMERARAMQVSAGEQLRMAQHFAEQTLTEKIGRLAAVSHMLDAEGHKYQSVVVQKKIQESQGFLRDKALQLNREAMVDYGKMTLAHMQAQRADYLARMKASAKGPRQLPPGVPANAPPNFDSSIAVVTQDLNGNRIAIGHAGDTTERRQISERLTGMVSATQAMDYIIKLAGDDEDWKNMPSEQKNKIAAAASSILLELQTAVKGIPSDKDTGIVQSGIAGVKADNPATALTVLSDRTLINTMRSSMDRQVYNTRNLMKSLPEVWVEVDKWTPPPYQGPDESHNEGEVATLDPGVKVEVDEGVVNQRAMQRAAKKMGISPEKLNGLLNPRGGGSVLTGTEPTVDPLARREFALARAEEMRIERGAQAAIIGAKKKPILQQRLEATLATLKTRLRELDNEGPSAFRTPTMWQTERASVAASIETTKKDIEAAAAAYRGK